MATITASPRYRPANARSGRPLTGIATLGIVVVALVLAVWKGVATTMSAPTLDRQSGCRTDVPAPAAIAVLVDRTDRLSATHLAAIQAVFHHLVSAEFPAVPVYGRVIVDSIDADGQGQPRRLADVCRPPLTPRESPTGASPDWLRRQFENGYARRLNSVVDALGRFPVESDISPLLAALKQVSQSPEFRHVEGPRQLVMASDLLENAGPIRENDAPRLELARLLATPYGQELVPDLRGVEVTMLYLRRKRAGKTLQVPSHQTFWNAWLARGGAARVHWQSIDE